MLLDDFLPTWDVRLSHAADVGAPPRVVYAAVRRLDLGSSPINRVLFAARGLVARGMKLSDLMARGFVLLGEAPPRELLLGLVARPWTLMGGIRRLDAEGFRRFDRPGYARLGWSFVVEPRGEGSTLTTETRVRCTDAASRRKFGWYWRVIGPFSAVVRKEALLHIKRDAESSRPEIP
jgi:hypothetical protein